jgi:hypothetical protein
VLAPTQAYVDWANSCGPGPQLVLSEMRDDALTVYLIPEVDVGPENWLREHYLALFEQELHAWSTDVSTWPRARSFASFQRFFTVHFHPLVFDMGDEPIAGKGD